MDAQKDNQVTAVVTDAEDTTVEDTTVYPETETIVRTPQEAAEEVLTPPASSYPAAQTEAAPISQTLPPGVVERRIEGDRIVEVMDQKEGLPIAASGDDDYQARLNDTSVNYTQSVEEDETGVVEKA